MSEPNLSRTGYDELRRHFAVWTLAILGTLTGSDQVRLDAAAWSTDDPPAGSPANATAEKKGSDEKSEDEKKSSQIDRAKLMSLVQAKKFDEAKVMVDTAMSLTPTDSNLYYAGMLAASMAATDAPDSIERLKAVVDEAAARLGDSDSPMVKAALVNCANSLAGVYQRNKNGDEAVSLLTNLRDMSTNFKDKTISSSLTASLARSLVQSGRAKEGESLLLEDLESAMRLALGNEATADARLNFALAISNYGSTFGNANAEKLQQYRDAANEMFAKAIDLPSANSNDLMQYINFQVTSSNLLAKQDAPAAMKILEDLEAKAEAFAAKRPEAEQARIKSMSTMIKSSKDRLQARLLHTTLIGQPAPEFEIAEVAEMPKVSWADLKGKVVLIDFWAVWCGPCIATFPHLRQWQKEYGDKGLVIIGVTRQYGYKWDADANRTKADKSASLEDELAMLGEFRKHHELSHGFVLTPQGSEYSKKFGVTGIPQAVLVDQNGIVQMIRVGSGEENAEQLEAKIKSLLGVTPEGENKPAGS